MNLLKLASYTLDLIVLRRCRSGCLTEPASICAYYLKAQRVTAWRRLICTFRTEMHIFGTITRDGIDSKYACNLGSTVWDFD